MKASRRYCVNTHWNRRRDAGVPLYRGVRPGKYLEGKTRIMPALRNTIALSLASLALTATLSVPASAQNYPENPVGKPDAARPGAIPMFKPPLYPMKPAPNFNGKQPVGNQIWIFPGGNGGSTVIVNNNYPGYYPGYPGVYYPGSNITITPAPGYPAPGYPYRNVAPVVVDSNNAVRAEESAALRQALADMTRAWERRDAAALGRHLAPDLSIAVSENERYRLTLQPANSYRYLASLLGAVNTLSYRVYDVKFDGSGAAHLYATHRFRAAGSRQTQTANVRATLVNVDGRWSMTAISVAPGILPNESSHTSGLNQARGPRNNPPVSRP